LGTVVLEEKWPVLGRHDPAAGWLRIWTDLGRAPRTIDAYARGPLRTRSACSRADRNRTLSSDTSRTAMYGTLIVRRTSMKLICGRTHFIPGSCVFRCIATASGCRALTKPPSRTAATQRHQRLRGNAQCVYGDSACTCVTYEMRADSRWKRQASRMGLLEGELR
jgi:hypothetical protein